MRDIVGRRRLYFVVSALLTIPGLLFIVATPFVEGAGLRFSIDYTGGTKWEIRFERADVTTEGIKDVLAAQDLADSVVVSTGGGFFEIRTKPIGLQEAPAPTPTPSPGASPAASESPGTSPSPSPSPTATPSPSPVPAVSEIPTDGKLGEVAEALEAALGPIAEQRQLTTVGPVISSELTGQAILLVFLGSAGILLWITFRFADAKFGVTAIVALVHDVIVVVGLFAILGTFFGVEVDGLFVTAMLTVIGFSVHDTIVVFDRIRENRARHAGEPFADIVNHSILQTLGRSINTSFVVVLTLLALLLFGGSATRFFVLALLVGIVSGTYSSIFNASPLLVAWQEWDERRKGRTAGRPVRQTST